MKRLFVLLLICCGGYIATSTAQNYYLTSVANPQDSWLTIDNKTITLPAEAGTGYVQLKTNLSVSVSSRPTWLVVSQTSKGVLRIVRKANTSANARTGNIVLTAKDGKTLTLNMVQVGKDPVVITDKDGIGFYADKDTDSLTICSNVSFTVNAPDWIKVTPTSDSTFLFTSNKKLYDQPEFADTIYIKDAEGKTMKAIAADLKYHQSYWFQKPCFAVISDIHFGDENNQGWNVRMPRVFNTLNNYDPRLQYVFVVGDIANKGLEPEYQQVQAYFNDPQRLDPRVKRIIVRGNHDWFNGSAGVGYFDKYVSSKDNHYLIIQGYPFIALGLDGSKYSGETLNSETRKFLIESLKHASKTYPDKPIFVFTHTLPYHTVIGSYESDYGAYDSNLDDIFKNYPQVVSLNGHTHMGLMDPRQIYQKDYTVVNVGSQKSDSHPTKFPGRHHLGATSEIDYNAITEGIIVHVNEKDEVVFERWSTARGKKYATDWVIRPPYNTTNSFIYTPNRSGGKAPWWPNGAVINVSNMTSTSCHITFPQAIDDNEGVNRYIISVTNSSGQKIISDKNQSALQYMCTDQPSSITIPLTGLQPGIDITVSVEARDYYELISSKLTNTFRLPN